MTETALLNRIRLQAVKLGCVLLRNNNGMLRDRNGAYVRYGLGVGSSDLIGWTRIGNRAVFTAIEVKRPGQKPTKPQAAFLLAVQQAGGIACVASDILQVQDAIEEYQTLKGML